MHQGQGQEANPSSVPVPRNDAGMPASFAAKAGLVVVPTNEHFQLVRAEALDSGKVHELHRMVSAMQAAATKCDLAHEEMVRLAEFRLQIERDLGTYLAQVVTRGGHRSKSLRSTLLPPGVTRNQSSAYQRLAAIPHAVFHAYLEGVRDGRKLPTTRGAQAFAVQREPRVVKTRRKERVIPTTLTVSLLEACLRCLGTIDVLVGNMKAKVNAAIRLDANENLSEKLRGKVLVVEAAAPEVAMRSVAKQRLAGAIQEAIVVLARDIDHAWLAALGEGPWSCCFPRESGSPIVAHIGGHGRGFALVFARLGVVLDVRSEMSGDRPA